jgi:2-oxo-3-hexenedioate decarboxylase
LTFRPGDKEIQGIAEEAVALLGSGRQVAPFSQRHARFDLADAYRVAACVRDARRLRGERPVGRKIGFTNTAAWAEYAVDRPIFNYVFDTTVHDLAAGSPTLALTGFAEPRIEPEIVLQLARAPERGMRAEQQGLALEGLKLALR